MKTITFSINKQKWKANYIEYTENSCSTIMGYISKSVEPNGWYQILTDVTLHNSTPIEFLQWAKKEASRLTINPKSLNHESDKPTNPTNGTDRS